MEIGRVHGDDAYPGRLRGMFRSFHDTVPVIHQGPSSDLNAAELGPDWFRFVHVDGSHMYEAVTRDIELACDSRPTAEWSRSTTSQTSVIPASPRHSGPRSWNETWSRSPARRRSCTRPAVSDRATRYRDGDRGVRDDSTGNECKVTEIPESTILSVWSTACAADFPCPSGRATEADGSAAFGRRRSLFIPELHLRLLAPGGSSARATRCWSGAPGSVSTTAAPSRCPRTATREPTRWRRSCSAEACEVLGGPRRDPRP